MSSQSYSQPTIYRSGRNGSIVCDKKDSASCTLVKNSSSKTGVSTTLILVLMGLSVVLAEDSMNKDGLLIENTFSGIDNVSQHHFSDIDEIDTNRFYHLSDSDTYIADITYPSEMEKSNFVKRWNADNAPLGTWFTQYRVAQQGLWNQSWYPASGCFEQALGTNGNFELPWSQTTTWSANKGFHFEIGKDAAASLGFSVETIYSNGGNYNCSLEKSQGAAQIWTQKTMIWQDQQKRKCVRRDYGENGLHCHAWSANIHGDLPLVSPYQIKCNVGMSNVQC